jgi:hypothetical protein
MDRFSFQKFQGLHLLSTPSFNTAPFSTGGASTIIHNDSNSIAGVGMQNTNNGTVAEYRFVVWNNTAGSYLAFSMPSNGNTETLFDETRATGAYLFTNGDKDLRIGTVSANDVEFSTNNSKRLQITGAGDIIMNPEFYDDNFIGRKLTTGEWINYDTGLDTLTLDADSITCDTGTFNIDSNGATDTELHLVNTLNTFTLANNSSGRFNLERNDNIIVRVNSDVTVEAIRLGASATQFNRGANNLDFEVYKNTSGVAINYDAGQDSLALSASGHVTISDGNLGMGENAIRLKTPTDTNHQLVHSNTEISAMDGAVLSGSRGVLLKTNFGTPSRGLYLSYQGLALNYDALDFDFTLIKYAASQTGQTFTSSGTTVTFAGVSHGLQDGDGITVQASTNTNDLPLGSYTVTVLDSTTFTVTAAGAGDDLGGTADWEEEWSDALKYDAGLDSYNFNSKSFTIDNPVDGAVLTNHPTGSTPLAIASVQYVIDNAGQWDRIGTVLSPKTAGDSVRTDGAIGINRNPTYSLDVFDTAGVPTLNLESSTSQSAMVRFSNSNSTVRMYNEGGTGDFILDIDGTKYFTFLEAGSVVWNVDQADINYRFYKLTSGSWLFYEAGLDTLDLDASTTTLTASTKVHVDGKLQVGDGDLNENYMAVKPTSSNTTVLYLEGNGNTTKPIFSMVHNALATNNNTGKVFAGSVVGESLGRFMFYSDGAYGMGGGTLTRDTFIFREAAGVVGIANDAWTPTTGGLKVYGSGEFNAGLGDNDFTVNKQTSGQAINYDAGLDTLDLDA